MVSGYSKPVFTKTGILSGYLFRLFMRLICGLILAYKFINAEAMP